MHTLKQVCEARDSIMILLLDLNVGRWWSQLFRKDVSLIYILVLGLLPRTTFQLWKAQMKLDVAYPDLDRL